MKAVEPKPKLTSLLNLNRHISSTGSIQYALKLATTQEVKCSDDSSSGLVVPKQPPLRDV